MEEFLGNPERVVPPQAVPDIHFAAVPDARWSQKLTSLFYVSLIAPSPVTRQNNSVN